MKKILTAMILLLSTISYSAEVSLDYNSSNGIYMHAIDMKYYAIPGGNIDFAIRFDNTGGINEGGLTNGFKIYLADNAGNPIPTGTFTPVTGTTNDDFIWNETSGFFDSFYPSCFSCDGQGIDTIGFGGVAAFFGTGFPPDYNDIAAYIHTGGLVDGDRICIDSSWFPPAGTWRWGSSGSIPAWSGPHCFDVIYVCPPPPEFDPSTPDTIVFNNCGTVSYQFLAHSTSDTLQVKYALSLPLFPYDELGIIDSITGVWTMEAAPEDDDSTYTMAVIAYDHDMIHVAERFVRVTFDIPEDTYNFDVNADCTSDISDLVAIIEYFFVDQPVPPNIHLGAVDEEPGLDIADVVYLIDFMFNDGPPPIR